MREVSALMLYAGKNQQELKACKTILLWHFLTIFMATNLENI